MDSGSYNHAHQAFLQALFARSTITFEEAKPILSAIESAYHDRPILPNDITHSSFQTTLTTLNAQLSPFAYEIRSLHPQTAPTRAPEQAVYALVNVTSDPQTALATLYTPDEIAFVRRLLDAIFDTNNTLAREVCAVKGMEAVRLARVPPTTQTQTQGVNGNGESQSPVGGQAASLTLDRAEKLVDGLVEQAWMDRSAAGYLTLSTRSLMELGQWLVETYNEPVEVDGGEGSEREWQRIKMCEGCKQIVTIGQRCSNQACLCRLHDFCVDTFFRGQDARKCPLCRSEWTGRNFVGERAARGMASAPSRSSGAHLSRGR